MKTMKVIDLQKVKEMEVSSLGQHLWRWLEFGNDHYYFPTSLQELKEIGTVSSKNFEWSEKDKRGWVDVEVSLAPLVDYLEKYGIIEDEEILIHWWW